jgi:predicted nucleic acid-binding protein
MTALVFVDTNAMVYARDPAERRKQQLAAHWIDELWAAGCGRLSAQVLSEYYNTVTRKLSPGLSAAEAAEDIEALFAWDPVPVDVGILTAAFAIEDRYQLSWWDSLIVAAAQRAGCRYLLSEDFQAEQDFGGLTVVNPFEADPAAVLA